MEIVELFVHNSHSQASRSALDSPSQTQSGPIPHNSASSIRPTYDKPPHSYCFPRIDDDDQRAVIYCLDSNYLHAGPWISYFNCSNATSLPYPEFRELYFNGLGLSYTRS
ncbi:hypothetical protein RclHR1_04300008 [Rhizophagus clarus]|uniref:Uncharacterized protein n=1 Tax=Rhizophagus clarus TaxID=94130 RepID=A0A2Z6RG91_9GLOM|nr:hypothetical protein RclHR1_04300008 [Rhizophagus clarus]